MRDRVVEFVALIVDDADIVERLRQVRIDRERPAAGGERRVALTGEPAHLAEVAVVERNRSVRHGGASHQVDRGLQVAGLIGDDAEEVQDRRVLRPGAQDVAAQRLGGRKPAGLQMLLGERQRLVEG